MKRKLIPAPPVTCVRPESAVCNITCRCGHTADFNAFRTGPKGLPLLPWHYRCPDCKQEWRIHFEQRYADQAFILRADGTPPYNGHLWPTESWWLGHEHRRFDSRWHFEYIALSDGRFATDGSVYSYARNRCCYDFRCIYPTREAAIRGAAAHLIRSMRWSRRRDGHHGGLDGEDLTFAINWTLERVAKETKSPAPRTVTVRPRKPEPHPTGLPLFDFKFP